MRDNPLDTHIGGPYDRLHDFFGQVLREVIEDVLDTLADLLTARPQGLKSRHFAPIPILARHPADLLRHLARLHAGGGRSGVRHVPAPLVPPADGERDGGVIGSEA